MSTDDTLSYDVFVSEPIPLNVTGLLPNSERRLLELDVLSGSANSQS